MSDIKIVLKQHPNGWYSASIPAFGGITTQGKTRSEAIDMAYDALSTMIEYHQKTIETTEDTINISIHCTP